MKYITYLASTLCIYFILVNPVMAGENFTMENVNYADTLPNCFELIEPVNGIISLSAIKGKGIGPKIQYMEEWKAFGWFNESDRIEWIIEVQKPGKYDIYLEWSAEGGVIGNPYQLIIGKKMIQRNVKDTGSWEVFDKESIGSLRLKEGLYRVIIRPDPEIEKGGYFDVRSLELKNR